MPELFEEQRESWGTRGGFVLAAVGSAVGLGNLWRFPYELYDHGGGSIFDSIHNRCLCNRRADAYSGVQFGAFHAACGPGCIWLCAQEIGICRLVEHYSWICRCHVLYGGSGVVFQLSVV